MDEDIKAAAVKYVCSLYPVDQTIKPTPIFERMVNVAAFAIAQDREERGKETNQFTKRLDDITKKMEAKCIRCEEREPAFCRQCMRDTKANTLAAKLERMAEEYRKKTYLYRKHGVTIWKWVDGDLAGKPCWTEKRDNYHKVRSDFPNWHDTPAAALDQALEECDG